jgi:hypothetical protein
MKEIKPDKHISDYLENIKIAEEEIKIFMGVPRRYLGTVKNYIARGNTEI